MKVYLDLLKKIMDEGCDKSDRTGTGTRSIFGTQMRFNLEEGFPLVTTKKCHLKSIIHELLWFISGSTNIKYLQENGVRIWNEWADENGDLGPVYGKQWRNWNGIDQIQNVIDTIKNNPFSRRILVSAWNVSDLEKMALPPCHLMFQFYVEPDENGKPSKLSLCWTQRSVDVALGLPFNIASYSLLLCLVAEVVGLTPHEVICNLGDTHIYLDHIEPLKQQIQNKLYKLPSLEMPIVKDLNIETIKQLKVDDFVLRDYHCNSSIKMKMSV